MKTFLFLCLLGATQSRLYGFESNFEIIQSSNEIIFQKMESTFLILDYYFNTIESQASNEQLFTEQFIDTFNQYNYHLESIKGEVFRQLKLVLKNISFIKTREKAFDLHLKEDYSHLVSFLANLELEANIQELFRDFVGQKNLLFYDVRQMYQEINELAIVIINTYDHMEGMKLQTFGSDTNNMQKLDLPHIKEYRYVIGFIQTLKEIRDKFLDKKEKLEAL